MQKAAARQLAHQSLWIALVEVVPTRADAMPEISGAYTNALVLATSEKLALRRISETLAAEGFDVVRAGDVERYASRSARCVPAVDVREAAELAESSGNVEFGDFFTWLDGETDAASREGQIGEAPAAPPIEIYSDRRAAEFHLSNSVDAADYEGAKAEVRAIGLDPDTIPHRRPAS